MRRVTSFGALTAALVLVGCASQAPATSGGTPTGQSLAAPSSATGTGQSLAATSSATGTGGVVTSSAAPQKDKFIVPAGYKQVVVNGLKVFCHSVSPPDSRIKQTECFTQDQLQQAQTASQEYLEGVQRMDSASMPNGVSARGINPAGASQGGR